MTQKKLACISRSKRLHLTICYVDEKFNMVIVWNQLAWLIYFFKYMRKRDSKAFIYCLCSSSCKIILTRQADYHQSSIYWLAQEGIAVNSIKNQQINWGLMALWCPVFWGTDFVHKFGQFLVNILYDVSCLQCHLKSLCGQKSNGNIDNGLDNREKICYQGNN